MEIYTKLLVWQKAMALARMVYVVAKTFPADERYALTDQLRRAVVSIPSNIAEGCGRASNKDYAHFVAIARGSLFETMTQLQLAKDFGYVEEEVADDGACDREGGSGSLYSQCFSLADEIGRMLTSMLKKFGSINCPTTTTNYN